MHLPLIYKADIPPMNENKNCPVYVFNCFGKIHSELSQWCSSTPCELLVERLMNESTPSWVSITAAGDILRPVVTFYSLNVHPEVALNWRCTRIAKYTVKCTVVWRMKFLNPWLRPHICFTLVLLQNMPVHISTDVCKLNSFLKRITAVVVFVIYIDGWLCKGCHCFALVDIHSPRLGHDSIFL